MEFGGFEKKKGKTRDQLVIEDSQCPSVYGNLILPRENLWMSN